MVESCTASGNLNSWLQRYKLSGEWKVCSTAGVPFAIERCDAIDNWGTGACRITKIKATDSGELPSEIVGSFIEKAKTLRHHEHAHIVPVIDFFIAKDALHYVTRACPGSMLCEYASRQLLPSAAAITFCMQFAGIVSFFAGQAPDMVPTIADQDIFVTADDSLIVCNFELSYFFAPPENNVFKRIAQFTKLVGDATESGKWKDSLIELSSELSQPKPPSRVSTLSKLKTRLKHLHDSQAAEALSTSPVVRP